MNVLRQLFSLSFWWSVAWRTLAYFAGLFFGFALFVAMGWVIMSHVLF